MGIALFQYVFALLAMTSLIGGIHWVRTLCILLALLDFAAEMSRMKSLPLFASQSLYMRRGGAPALFSGQTTRKTQVNTDRHRP